MEFRSAERNTPAVWLLVRYVGKQHTFCIQVHEIVRAGNYIRTAEPRRIENAEESSLKPFSSPVLLVLKCAHSPLQAASVYFGHVVGESRTSGNARAFFARNLAHGQKARAGGGGTLLYKVCR